MKLFSLKNLFLLLCCAAPFVYLNSIFDSLPDQVAMHFGSDMKPNRFGDKSNLWSTVSIMMGIGVVAYLIITNVGKLDPKNQSLQSQGIMEKLGITSIVFISLLTIYIIYTAVQGESGNLLFVLLGGFFAIIGNFLYSIKPNYFVGFRLPWTLENQNNWRKTHQLGGKIWVVGGMLAIILSFIVPEAYMMKLFIAIVLLMVIIPTFNSYTYHKAGNQ